MAGNAGLPPVSVTVVVMFPLTATTGARLPAAKSDGEQPEQTTAARTTVTASP